MSKAIGGLFGGGSAMKQQQAMMAQQMAAIAEEKRRVKAVEDGQARARSAGRGLLSFVDGPEMTAALGGAAKKVSGMFGGAIGG